MGWEEAGGFKTYKNGHTTQRGKVHIQAVGSMLTKGMKRHTQGKHTHRGKECVCSRQTGYTQKPSSYTQMGQVHTQSKKNIGIYAGNSNAQNKEMG